MTFSAIETTTTTFNKSVNTFLHRFGTVRMCLRRSSQGLLVNAVHSVSPQNDKKVIEFAASYQRPKLPTYNLKKKPTIRCVAYYFTFSKCNFGINNEQKSKGLIYHQVDVEIGTQIQGELFWRLYVNAWHVRIRRPAATCYKLPWIQRPLQTAIKLRLSVCTVVLYATLDE